MDTIVLGGGISGLAAARSLRDRGVRCSVLERCPTLGGLTRTVNVGEFCFDYTGHFLHLARCEMPSEVPFANLRDDEWQRVERRSCCLVDGNLITAPIQYNLGELPPDERARCVESYDGRPELPASDEVTFRDFVVAGFGQRLSDIFLIPQNEKTMATSLDRLSMAAVKRFFPPPDETKVRAGIRGEGAPAEYNSRFWYPVSGGIDRLVHGLASGVEHALTGREAVALDLERHEIRVRTGEVFRYEQLYSSVPLRELCQMSGDPELVTSSAALSHSATVTVNIGINGELPPALRDVHWIYVPDRDVPFYRVGCYSNISGGTATPGHHALYVEAGFPAEKVDEVNIAEELEPRIVAGLTELGLLDPADVMCLVTHVIRCAYVHHTPSRDNLVEELSQRLADADVHVIGRYGQWDYISMEDSIHSALDVVERICP